MKKNTMNQTALKIILVDENMGRSAILRRALQDKGHEVISRLEESETLLIVMKLLMQMLSLLMQTYQMRLFLLTLGMSTKLSQSRL